MTRSQLRSPEPCVCRRRDCLPGHIYDESFFRHLRTKPGSKRGRWQDRRQGPVMMGPGRGTEKGEENPLHGEATHASVNESARDPASRGTCTVPSCCIRRRPPPDPSLSLSLSIPEPCPTSPSPQRPTTDHTIPRVHVLCSLCKDSMHVRSADLRY